MGASDLMKKYGLSNRGLTKIFNKLISAGLVEARELLERYPSFAPVMSGSTASKDTVLTLSIPVPINDRDSSATGFLRDVSSETIRVAGIKAHVGEIKTFQIAVDNFMAADPLEVTTQCTWVDPKGEEKEDDIAGFEFVNLTNSQRDTLNRFIKVMFLSSSGEWRVASS
jgi:hypothetical protein